MTNRLWVIFVAAGFLLAFLVGYNVSIDTGVEPGYFDAPETGGYGAGTEGKGPAGISDELQEYYKNLGK